MMVVQVPEVGDDVRHKDGISDGGDVRPKIKGLQSPTPSTTLMSMTLAMLGSGRGAEEVSAGLIISPNL